MTSRQIELALKKQRLLFRSAEQRRQLAADMLALTPVLSAVEHLRSSVRWMRDNPVIVVGTLVALVVARPHTVFRWTRRLWLAWLAWRKWGNHDSSEKSLMNRLKKRLNTRVSDLLSR
jgi:hypothetical protein